MELGRVRVNGKPVRPGDKLDPDEDMVYVDGKRVEPQSGRVCIMLYKPRGYITTMSDEQGRRCVASLVSDAGARVYPVGRLDRESEGLLLFTNDGELANAIAHPSGRISKTYRVTVSSRPTDEQLTILTQSAMLDGKKTVPASVKVLESSFDRSVLEMTLREGRNREIRRLCENAGLEVIRLKRLSVGPLSLGSLQPGKWRKLTPAELAAIRNAVKPARN